METSIRPRRQQSCQCCGHDTLPSGGAGCAGSRQAPASCAGHVFALCRAMVCRWHAVPLGWWVAAESCRCGRCDGWAGWTDCDMPCTGGGLAVPRLAAPVRCGLRTAWVVVVVVGHTRWETAVGSGMEAPPMPSNFPAFGHVQNQSIDESLPCLCESPSLGSLFRRCSLSVTVVCGHLEGPNMAWRPAL